MSAILVRHAHLPALSQAREKASGYAGCNLACVMVASMEGDRGGGDPVATGSRWLLAAAGRAGEDVPYLLGASISKLVSQ